ncbi:COG complex component, COG2-domain-containing protein [Xylaria sp. CBS 124048]|nr:COG complex component, COG2-domain-containing protein [Xylaria sp. CBS 124048]
MPRPADLVVATSGFSLNSPTSAIDSSPASPSPSSPLANEGDAPLPFPTALPRSDFLAPSFDPAIYLSSLRQRHQTLEDLRSDLRDRKAAIGAELLALVNANYASFLRLGVELKGGEDRVEDLRVALLGFERAVEEIRGLVRERRVQVDRLRAEMGTVRSEIETGRKILELDDRISALEGQLAVGSMAPDSEESEDEEPGSEDDGPDGLVGSSATKLAQLASDYMAIDELAEDIGKNEPLVRKLEERMIRCRNTLILDLNTASKEASKAGLRGRTKVFKLMGLYSALDAHVDAVKVLKNK